MDVISTRSAADHMTLNVGKCMIMQCSFGKRVSPPPQASAYGSTVPIVNSMTLLGVTLSPSLKWDQHMEGLICRANGKRHFLAVLGRAGVGAPHLMTFYTVFISPTLEYAAPVWHPGLTQRLSDDLERFQRLCLRTILPELSYSKALAALDLPQLCARRQKLCRNFARAAFPSRDFRDWFPADNFRQTRHAYYLRNNNQLSIPRCHTDRLKNSPVHYLARFLNTK